MLLENNYGPEGGGSFSCVVFGGEPFGTRRFELSNNMSNGAPSTPQHIPGKVYRATLKELRRHLVKCGFTGVKASSSPGNQFHDDDLAVSVSAKKSVAESILKPCGKNKFVCNDYVFSVNKQNMTILKDEKVCAAIPTQQLGNDDPQFRIYMVPGKHMIIVTIVDPEVVDGVYLYSRDDFSDIAFHSAYHE
jgi:hypothetical protein